MKRKKNRFLLTAFVILGCINFIGCVTASPKTVQLSEITQKQTSQLQQSHIQFVQLYYQKLRDEVNDFMVNKWIPSFLSKATQNQKFRTGLDQAYLVANIKKSDIEITWKDKPLEEPYKSTILSGVEQVITDERSRLGKVLLGFAKGTQKQINKRRQSLLDPINKQERMVIDKLNAAYADLQSAQASIKAFLESVVEVKENQDLILKKLNALEQRDKIMKTVLDANDKLSKVLAKSGDAEKIVKEFFEKAKELEDKISK